MIGFTRNLQWEDTYYACSVKVWILHILRGRATNLLLTSLLAKLWLRGHRAPNKRRLLGERSGGEVAHF